MRKIIIILVAVMVIVATSLQQLTTDIGESYKRGLVFIIILAFTLFFVTCYEELKK